ncbi:MAG: alpha-amylase family glycosyl hydrolase [Chitinophagales bacterium]|nr:alpha-amylase family glycosyl hydrolase [Chitinophagales bacterium]MDW8428069.1 alpha-amylase family glycosyl hydrolase [Chitinophagales bacterium]
MGKLFLGCFLIVLTACRQPANPVSVNRQDTVPPIEKIVMYEVFVRNFTASGTFEAMLAHLPRLRQLGVNVLWLMPVQPTGLVKKKGTYGSPYSIRNYTALHPDLGTAADFRRLVDSIHALGMFIILDHVANHTAWDHVWVQQHPEWYTRDSAGHMIPSVPDWTDIADLNYEQRALWDAQIASMKYWIDSFNIDGFRCDVAEMVPLEFWKEAIGHLRQLRPLLMLAEGADPKLYEAGFNMTYGWEMYHGLKKVWNGQASARLIDSLYRREQQLYPPQYRHLRFITNHDENSWDDVPQRVFISEKGAQAAFVVQLTLPGVPFLYNGQEVGYEQRINLFEKYIIDWQARPDLQQWYQRLLQFYHNSAALQKGAIEFWNSDDVLCYRRQADHDQSVFVVVNCRNRPVRYPVPEALSHQRFTNIITGQTLTFHEEIGLNPFDHYVLMAKQKP